MSPEIFSLHQCVLFWKAYTLDLNLVVESIRTWWRHMWWIQPEFGQPEQCVVKYMGVNLIFYSIGRTDMLWEIKTEIQTCRVLFQCLYWFQMCRAGFQVEFGSLSPTPALPLLLVLAYSCSSSGAHMAQPATYVENALDLPQSCCWLVGFVWGSVTHWDDSTISIPLEIKWKGPKGVKWFLCPSWWYSSLCLRGGIPHTTSLGSAFSLWCSKVSFYLKLFS